MNNCLKPRFLLPAIYVFLCLYLIGTQGLFGESFIAIILGFPWSFALAFFEFGNVSGAMIYVLVLAPIALNTAILWWIGSLIGKKR